MPERFQEAIIKYLAGRNYQPLKPRQLARTMGVGEEDYGSFREAVKRLRDSGRVVLGSGNALTLPEMSNRVVGTLQANPRGFGFVQPETPNAHGDLYIPAEEMRGAMDGDQVVARVVKRGKRGGEMLYSGRITEILKRGATQVAGTLEKAEGAWFVVPDARPSGSPVLIADVGPGAKPGLKVTVEIVEYPAKPGDLARGVIVERLGGVGDLAAETMAVIRAHGLIDEFSEEALDEARQVIADFDPDATAGREDLTDRTVITIDPPDARDFDDAISIRRDGDGYELGVHIADVSAFVAEGGTLDEEARQRSTSVYFPRRVIPMLPEVLSNGICSLQEDRRRFCLSAFISYDADGNVTGSRLSETVIRSARRLTYLEAQGVIDGKTGGYDAETVELLQTMNELARRVEKRRRKAGMIHLDLPEIELVLDDGGKVVDAEEADDSYTHTIIEMFMVEANEAVARALNARKIPCLRRIHPSPDPASGKQLASFVRVCGHKIPRNVRREDLQRLLETVRGKPESYAVNLAVLKSFQQAEYSPMTVGHFALASEHYCHFTSPIRRYPDLTVHRLVRKVVRGEEFDPPDPAELIELGEHCSTADRRAEAAGNDLKDVLVLQLLETKVGDVYDGVITGVTSFGAFIRIRKFGIEGLIRMADLGDDWWEVAATKGEIRGERSGRRFRIGDPLEVQIASVNLPARQLNLLLPKEARKAQQGGGQGKKKRRRRKGRSSRSK
jgi:ribonuclease R